MDIRILAKILGGLLVVFSALLIAPGLHSLISSGNRTDIWFQVAGACFLFGIVLWLAVHKHRGEMRHRMGFAVVTFSWAAACVIGSLPYFFSGVLPSFMDALFESTSGFTGTGASVLTDIESVDPSLLLWRSMTQWLGGMGIIVFFIAILPILGVGVVQLFKAETPGPQKDKITPRVRETAKKLWILYVGFTALLAALLVEAGMSPFDAVNHSMTTLATGGFSTRNTGIAYYDSAAIDYILILFMVIGSINFSLHYRLIAHRDLSVVFTTELKAYLAILCAAALAVCFSTWGPNYSNLAESFRNSLFVVVATASSTGYSHADYIFWPVFTHSVLICLMVMGGMSGSTAGGLKCIRLVAASKQMLRELKQAIHPNAVLTLKADDHSISDSLVNAIWGLIFIYFVVFSISTTVLAIEGVDLTSGATATFSALSNVGPAFGSLGPTENYAALSPLSKAMLSICMLLGRLEFYTVIVIFMPMYWKK